jgi:hypothetical protein
MDIDEAKSSIEEDELVKDMDYARDKFERDQLIEDLKTKPKKNADIKGKKTEKVEVPDKEPEPELKPEPEKESEPEDLDVIDV